MTAEILQGSVFDLLPTLKPGSVDAVVTSPPYWCLRSYLPKDHPLKPLELGSEKTPAEFVANMVRVFGLVREVMAPHATCWLNIGDTYMSGDGSPGGKPSSKLKGTSNHVSSPAIGLKRTGLSPGNLCLIPQRLALALQSDGWIVRSVVVWHKPAPMPASVAGWRWTRCRVKVNSDRGHRTVKAATNGRHRAVASFKDERSEAGRALSAEGNPQWSDCPGCPKCEPNGGYVLRKGSWRPTSSWEPVLMLAKSERYFCDGEAVKQPPSAGTVSRNLCAAPCKNGGREGSGKPLTGNQADGGDMRPDDPYAMANLRDVWRTRLEDMTKEDLIGFIQSMDQGEMESVWRIAAEPLCRPERHYAAFPSELVHRCLKSATSAKGYCPECGGPWVRVVETSYDPNDPRAKAGKNPKAGCDFHGIEGGRTRGDLEHGGFRPSEMPFGRAVRIDKTLGWRPSCTCQTEQPPRPGLVLDPFSGSGRTGIECKRLGLDYIGLELNQDYVEMSHRLLAEQMPLFG